MPLTTSSVAAHHALLVRDAALQSPVSQVLFRGQRMHVKRDDVFHLAGNKVRLCTSYMLNLSHDTNIASLCCRSRCASSIGS